MRIKYSFNCYKSIETEHVILKITTYTALLKTKYSYIFWTFYVFITFQLKTVGQLEGFQSEVFILML